MEEVQELIRWLLLAALPLGTVARVVYCLCCIPTDNENAGSMGKRIRNALIFLACAECIGGLLDVITGYFF